MKMHVALRVIDPAAMKLSHIFKKKGKKVKYGGDTKPS